MNKLKSIALLPLAGSKEFDNLPNGYFWLHDLKMSDGTIVEPLALNARTKEQMIALLRQQIKCMSLNQPTSIVSGILPNFRLCLHAIEKKVTWKVPFEVVQKLKKCGVYLLPENVIYVANIPCHVDEDVYWQ